MPHTGPDFGNYYPRVTTAPLGDVGELAVRLGSINSYDRRGLVVEMDDFEGMIIKGGISLSHVDDYCRLDSSYARSGSQSLKMHVSDALGRFVDFVRYYPIVGSQKLGYEVSFHWADTNCALIVYLNYSDGVTSLSSGFKLDPTAWKSYILDSDGDWEEIGTLPTMGTELGQLHTVKLVVDFKNRKYMRLMLNQVEYDLSAHAIWVVGLTTEIFILSELRFEAVVDAGNDNWIDDSILTQDEP